MNYYTNKFGEKIPLDGDMRVTPRDMPLGLLADGAAALKQGLNDISPFGARALGIPDAVARMSPLNLSSLLGEMPEFVNDLSYGEGKGSGTGMAYQVDPRVGDLLATGVDVALPAGLLARSAGKALVRNVSADDAVRAYNSLTNTYPVGSLLGGTKLSVAPDQFQGVGKSRKRVQPRGQSLADATAEGWKHPIGAGKNLKIHMDDMDYVIDDTANLAPKVTKTPDDLLGMTGIYTAGDRSRTGGNLLSVNSEDLPIPVRAEGGGYYSRDNSHPYAWASKDEVMSNLESTTQGALDRGTQPVSIFEPMEHQSMDFNTMMNDSVLGLLQRDLSPTNKKKFDVEMRKAIKMAQTQKKPKLTNVSWKGLDDPDTLSQLDELGDLRHAFNATAKRSFAQNMKGSPDLPSIRYALTEPDFMDAEGLGHSMSLLKGGLVKNAPDGHSTYETSMYGDYFGSLDDPSTKEKMFPSFFEHRRITGRDTDGDRRAFDLKKPWQLFDRQTIAEMKDEPLRAIEGSSTGERVPFGSGGHLENLHKQPYAVKQAYDDALGDFNPYKAAGFDVDDSHKAVGAWSENGDTQFNPVRVEKPIFENGLIDNAMDNAGAVEHYKGLVNVQAGSPYNIQKRVPQDEANAIRFNFRKEPTIKDVESMARLGAENDMILSPSGHGNYSLLNTNPEKALPSGRSEVAVRLLGDGSKENKGLLKGSQSALAEPVKSSGDYIDLSGELSTKGKGKATQAALDSWAKVEPMMEKMLGGPTQKQYVRNKMIVDARTAKETGDITREDYSKLYSILSDPKLSGAEIIKKLKEGVRNGGLPAVGFFQVGEDED